MRTVHGAATVIISNNKGTKGENDAKEPDYAYRFVELEFAETNGHD